MKGIHSMNKKTLIALLCVPLLLSVTSCGCKGKTPSSDSSGTDKTESSESSESSETIDEDTLVKYMNDLKASSQGNHFYYHYLRYDKTASDYNNWDLWIWPYRPKEGQGVRFDWVGRTTAADRLSASGDAIVDSLGYTNIDIDLTLTYDGGWDADTLTMGGTPVNFVNDGVLSKFIGTQLVYSESRLSDSGFWRNDGGNVYVELDKFALQNDDGSTSYHVFARQDNVSEMMSNPAGVDMSDPFAGDKGNKTTYGDDSYNTADWNDKAIKGSSEQFLKTAGVGYQIMVSSFADSDGDGFGDIYGIEQKLPYLKALGVKVLWLTPIQKSDSYHGYDIADYLAVDTKFGSAVSPAAVANNGQVTEATAMADYESLLNAAHENDMLVVMDLVLNHTSTTNTWFIKSAQLDNKTRGYYQWGNNVTQAEHINENNYWYPYGDHVYSYYAKFGSSMPELNYAYADTRTAVITMAKEWCRRGVDGFRMDAVKHIFLQDEIDYDENDTYISDTGSGINYSSDLTKNLNFWREVNYEVKSDYPNAFFVGENFDGHAYHVAPFYEGFDSLFDFYSYFNLTSIASYFFNNGNTGAYQGAHAASFLGQWNSSATKYSGSSDTDLFGNKTKSIKYGNGWNLAGVLDTNNKYRTGGSSATDMDGYSMINGAFTSNHDIARAINRVAGNQYDLNGLTAQGEVTKANYDNLLGYTTLVEIIELMLPGLTWIYYGDELGMTGNFPDGKDAESGYADLAYRQPMKWTSDGVIGDGSMTTGYGISGSDSVVEWDEINMSNKVPSAAEQVEDASSHYSILKAFANAKNADQALINGNYAPYYTDITNEGAQKSVASFTRTLNGTTYRVVANFGSNAVSLSSGGTVVASYNGATASSVPGKAAVLIKLAGSTPVETVTYTITNYPAGKTAEHYAIHAWGGSAGDGQRYEGTLNGSTLTVKAPENITGFLVVAYNGTFDWDNLVYKSSDVTVTPGTTEYALPDPASDITLTITGIPSQYQSGYDLYVYFWGSTESSKFVKATVSGSSMTADVPADITGFLVVIMQQGKTPGWSGTDGFVKQSENYPYQSGTLSYTWAALK